VYDLFFTTERVIAFIIQHPGDIPRQYTSIWQTVFLGSGWEIRKEQRELERTAQAQRRASQGLTPDELASTHPRNFGIPYSEITSVELTHRLFQSQLRFYVSRQSTAEQIIRFNLAKKQIPEARHLLELTLLSKTNRP
jgi:hypothetical protein